ncbi:MAG: hypothetical protein A2748_03410 [Candidatus Wildermuthbacteria bacterium RIFCSPHIGHO2_01_FULL_45_20]|nr:MAG: hypothetical protein A2748_03410 [Candidatus Wildermuthbacteria bacterium RIFCSPHIGHO2_01_FULL_45_20]
MLPRQDKDAYLLGTSGFLGGANEVALTKFLLKNLRGEDIFYDIGANFGFYTYLAHELISPEGSVHAFEPAPFVFSYLKKNCLGSANIFLNEIALFDQQTTKDFYDTSDTKHSGRATLIKEMLEEGLSFRKRAVKTTTLDRYLQNHPAPSFMKIDTEGSEYQILKGGESFLRHCSPIIVLEVWGGDKGRLSLRAVEILRELQFRAFLLKDNGDLEKFSLEQLKEFISKGKIRNFIFKK